MSDPGVGQFLFCDSYVHSVNEDVDIAVYREYGTMNGGEVATELSLTCAGSCESVRVTLVGLFGYRPMANQHSAMTAS